MSVQVIKAKRTQEQREDSAEKARQRVAAYCRVSTDMEEQESSYEAQCTHYTNYIRNNPDWIFAGIYADEGISGTSTRRREQFNRMIEDCEAGKIDFVVTKSISRFARNTLDCLKYIRKLKTLGIAVYFEKEAINTLDAKGEVLITIMASIAQQESQSISQNVRIGIQYRMQQGKGRLNTAYFMGLTKGSEPDTLAIVPEEAGIVRRIFREYLEGCSPAMIGKHLEKDEIRTSTGGRTWYQSTIVSMLENEKYCGDLLLQKYYTVDFLTHKIAKNTGQLPQYYVENNHEPIVPKRIYFQVQGELMRRASLKNDPSKLRYGSPIALSGRLVCGRCGRVLKRCVKPDGNGADWSCRSRACVRKTESREMKSTCGCRIVRESEAQESMIAAFNRLPEYRDELLRMQEQLRNGELKRIDALTEYSKEQEKRMEERRHVLEKEKSGEGRSELVFLGEQIARLQAERNSLILERADYANREVRIRLLLELMDLMKEKESAEYREAGRNVQVSSALTEPETGEKMLPADSPACSDYEDFFRRTRYELPDGILDKKGKIVKFDNSMVIRYLDTVTVLDDGYAVDFKAGIRIEIKWCMKAGFPG